MKRRTLFSSCQLLAATVATLAWGDPPSAFADPSLVRIAVFDFELDDFSAGGGIAGDAAADPAQLDRTTSEARRVISQSGRSLRTCNGCEAAIALKLGADQSLVGVVTRIGRTGSGTPAPAPWSSRGRAIFAWARIIPGIAARRR